MPGNSFNNNLGKNKFHKSQHFDINNEVPMMVGAAKPGIGGEPLLGQKLKPNRSVFPRGEGSDQPAWVAFDRQVLCFDAYFQEAVFEKREEQFRVRNCKVYFYLEDDSIQVTEARMKNSGIPQGTLIRRHRINRPPPRDDEFYTVEDFNVGKELNMYSKVFKITGCDEFTQNFLKKLGVRVNPPDNIPSDPYENYRKAMDESMQPLRPYEKHDTLKQFLEHDRHVLRFYCFWDDTSNMFGDPRELVLHYFLADDTIELREVIYPNSGRDAAPVFLHRAKLPKDIIPLSQPGEATDRTVLNVFGPTGHGGRYILDSLKTGAMHIQTYKDCDLRIGMALNVWGRPVLLCDCDEFTKEYYRTKYGVQDFAAIPYKRGDATKVSKQVPPYNGFGSEEDSLCSTQGLIPKPPKRDFIKFMEKDRHGLESNVLRFLARMSTTKPIDCDRRFIISVFLSDETIQVFEPPVRNSGIIGGKFLERGRIKMPNQPEYSTEPAEFYGASDFFVGANVTFNCHKFVLIDADEYAFHFMERFPDMFPKANVNFILERLKEKAKGREENIQSFMMREGGDVNDISYDRFHALMRQLDLGITDHEIMTLARKYSDQSIGGPMEFGSLLVIIQEQLRKQNFEGFSSLNENLIHHDRDRNGRLPPDMVRTACKAIHVPIPDDMLMMLLAKMAEQTGTVNYSEFLHHLNWRDYPVAPTAQTTQLEESYFGHEAKDAVHRVNIQALLGELSR